MRITSGLSGSVLKINKDKFMNKKKFRMLGITSGIGSMIAPAGFDADLKDKIEVVGNQEWRKYYNCGVFEENFNAPYWDDWNNVPEDAKKDIDIVMGHPECFINPKTKIYTQEGYKNIIDLRIGDMVLTHKNRFMPVVKLQHRDIEPDERSSKIKALYEAGNQTYEQLGERFNLSAASVCHIVKDRVGYDVEIVTVGYSPYSKDCIQVTLTHRLRVNGKWIEAQNIEEGDEIEVLHKDKESGIITFVKKGVEFLERKTVRAKRLYNFSVGDDASYVAKGIVSKNCGNFSILNNDRSKQNEENDIGEFVEKIAEVKPKFFLMDDLYKSLGVYPAEFYANLLPDYDLFFEPISNYHYGNIQKHRKRFFVVGARKELNFTWIPGEKPDHGQTTWDKIGDLFDGDIPEINHRRVDPNDIAKSFKDDAGDGHYLTYGQLAQKFMDIPPGKNLPYINKKGETKIRIGYVRIYEDKHCHVLYGGGAQGYPGAYHPRTGLPLTIRERARIQGFPDEFKFDLVGIDAKKLSHYEVKITGKAMPLEFCRYATKLFVAHLEGSTDFDDQATGQRFYGNIPEMITEEKEKYCENHGYTNQEKACNNCWHADRCITKLKRLTKGLIEF